MKYKIVLLILILILIFFYTTSFLVDNWGKNKEYLSPETMMTENINYSILVEEYIKENIKTIAPNQAVLGGSWYVVSVFVFDEIKSGIVTYEDGHIQSEAFFEYEIEKDTNNIKIKSFDVKK